MKIFVKTLKGSQFEIQVKPDDSVSYFSILYLSTYLSISIRLYSILYLLLFLTVFYALIFEF